MTAADAPNRFEDSSRPLAGNNETQQLTQAILETLKTIRALLEKLQAQDPGLAPLSIIVRGPYAGGDLPAEISMSSSRRSDRDEVVDRILARARCPHCDLAHRINHASRRRWS